jgi:hypothetical protein
MGLGGQRHALAALPPERTRYPLYGRLGGPHGRSGRVRNILPPSGFDPRTVQPVASRYTDWAIPAYVLCHDLLLCVVIFKNVLLLLRIPLSAVTCKLTQSK